MGAVKLVRRRERSKQRWQARKSLENGETPACLGIDKLGYSVGLEPSAEKFDKEEKKSLTMSSQQPFSAPPLVGEVHHIHHLSEHLGRLYISDEYSDVILIVEKNRIPAHKVG